MDPAEIYLFFLFLPSIIFLHIIFSHINQWLRVFKTGQELLFYLFILINILYFLIFIFYFDFEKSLSFLLYFFLVINLFFYSYFHLYNMTETARRIKILIMIRANKASTQEDFVRNYDVKVQIESRLNRLVKMHQLSSKNDFYYLKSKVLLYVATIFIFIKNTILGIK